MQIYYAIIRLFRILLIFLHNVHRIGMWSGYDDRAQKKPVINVISKQLRRDLLCNTLFALSLYKNLKSSNPIPVSFY